MIVFRNPQARIPEWTCRPGEKWLLVAPTGWGKSVWLRQVALLRDASASQVTWRNQPVTPTSVGAYRSAWQYLPQTGFRSADTIAANLRAVLNLQAHGARGVERFLVDFEAGLAQLGLSRIAIEHRSLRDLSGGELQATSLLRAVLLGAEGLFLDEPTSAMDGELTARTENWIAEHYSGAWVWVTHDERQAQRLRLSGARDITWPL